MGAPGRNAAMTDPRRRRASRDGTMHDAIIIGAGHNALVAAFYLAKAGRRPLVLERQRTSAAAR